VRIGYGWDSHEFKRGVPLKIGGIEITHSHGLAGHSDGDVLLHALTDALLGAIAAGDIGTYFPPSDPQWKGADSVVFVQEALRRVRQAGYAVANVDSTLILAKPKIGPHAKEMQARVAEVLGINATAVGIKAKTPEGMGTDEAAIAHVAVLLVESPGRDTLVERAAESVPQPVIDEVVKEVVKTVPAPAKKKTGAKSRKP
jgi:2-C-methyl-D-erythritol 2,4-cyclodiphosphate synthase